MTSLRERIKAFSNQHSNNYPDLTRTHRLLVAAAVKLSTEAAEYSDTEALGAAEQAFDRLGSEAITMESAHRIVREAVRCAAVARDARLR